MLIRVLGGEDVEFTPVNHEGLTPLDGTVRYG